MNKIFTQLGALCLALTLSTAALASTDNVEIREWAFRVYLDDSAIGTHRFLVTDYGNGREIQTEAEFNVKFLFFNAYQYRHRNTELWRGNCLETIESETDANGDRYTVRGSAEELSFVVSSVLDDDADLTMLPECVATFAYWDRDSLSAPRLLNTQTGEYAEVDAEFVGDDTLMVRGERVASVRYRLTGDDIEIDLWYSLDDEWLALESVTDGGRRLRYELT